MYSFLESLRVDQESFLKKNVMSIQKEIQVGRVERMATKFEALLDAPEVEDVDLIDKQIQ